VRTGASMPLGLRVVCPCAPGGHVLTAVRCTPPPKQRQRSVHWGPPSLRFSMASLSKGAVLLVHGHACLPTEAIPLFYCNGEVALLYMMHLPQRVRVQVEKGSQ